MSEELKANVVFFDYKLGKYIYPEYHITKEGKIYNTKYKRWIQTRISKRGYENAWLYHKGKRYPKRVARLLLLAYEFRPDHHKLTVDHVNFIKDDNRVENLEWVTLRENQRLGRRMRMYKRGERK